MADDDACSITSQASTLSTVATVESLILLITLICACIAYSRKVSSESVYRDVKAEAESANVAPSSPSLATFSFRGKKINRGPAWEINVKDIKYLNKIGQGNFGEVWRANWLGTNVAVKKVLPEHSHDEAFMTRFRDEIEIMADMHHPNVVMFLGASIDHANMCLVLEYCDYGDLISLLESREREINMHYNIKFAVDIARGIKYLHEKQNVIQRDVKGRNILVDRSLNAKISDFGLSRQKSNSAQMTACGTPAWIAPEIVRMENYTEQADVYSFAIASHCAFDAPSATKVMWEIYNKKEPYDGEGGLQVAYAAAEKGLRPPIPEVAPEVWNSLMIRCWNDKPDDRPNFSEILRALLDMMKKEQDPMQRADFYFGTPMWAKDDAVAGKETGELAARTQPFDAGGGNSSTGTGNTEAAKAKTFSSPNLGTFHSELELDPMHVAGSIGDSVPFDRRSQKSEFGGSVEPLEEGGLSQFKSEFGQLASGSLILGGGGGGL